jgi:hypothetical protein
MSQLFENDVNCIPYRKSFVKNADINSETEMNPKFVNGTAYSKTFVTEKERK